MKSRNKLTRLVARSMALLLVLLTVVSVFPFTANADSGFYEEGDADYDSSGGGKTDTTGEFNLSYTDDVSKQIVGYRITGIKANGEKQKKNGTDVYIKNAQYVKDLGQSAFETKFEGTSIYVSSKQYCKREFYLAESANSSLADGTTTEKLHYVYEWDYSLNGNIPTTEAEFDAWQKKTGNDDKLAKWAGYTSKSAMKNGDKIIVEPIYHVNNLKGTTCFLTVSEIANLGQSWYGGSSNGWTNTGASGDGAGTFGFISNYTNRKWPNAFYTRDGMGLWEGAEAISETKKRETFNNLLLKGYGVIILYDEPTLPDLYVDSIKFYTEDGTEHNKDALPINKTIYVVATYKLVSGDSVKANFFGLDNSGDRTGRTFSGSEMNVATGSLGQTSLFGAARGIYDSVTMTKYSNSTASNRYEATMVNGKEWRVVVGRISSTDSSAAGYFHAAVYLNDKTTATTSTETNTTNNYKSVMYEFAGEVTRDLELSSITLKVNGETITGSSLKNIPFGAKVEVYHTYKSNSKADGTSISEPYCVTLSGNTSNPKGMIMCSIDGNSIHSAAMSSTTKKVAEFYATSFVTETRYGAIYLKSDINYDAAEESNSDNNKKSITWAAKCDVQLYRIILKDANGNELGRYTRGGTNTVPTLSPGQSVQVYYVYKNTSGREVVVNGHGSQSASSGNIKASKVTVPANGTYTAYGYTFTVPSSGSSGSISGSVYVDKDTYGITSTSVTYTGCETNSSNNTLSMTYNIQTSKDVAITKIKFVYADANGNNVTQVITQENKDTMVAVFPRGARVCVWLTFANNKDESVQIDGYYKNNGTTGLSLMSNTTTEYNADGITLGNNGTSAGSIEKCAGSFYANTLADQYFYGAVFLDGKTDTSGDSVPGNNTLKAKYSVYGDIGIEIYFTDKNNNKVNPAEFWHTQEYKVWATITNYTPMGSQTVEVYYKGNQVGFDYNGDGTADFGGWTLDASGTAAGTYSFVLEEFTGSKLPENLGNYSVTASVYFYGHGKVDNERNIDGVPKTDNNTATGTYKIKAEVGIKDIIYKDENDVVISDPTKIKEGTKVKVYYVCTNAASVDTVVVCYCNGSTEVDEFVLPAGTTGTEIFVTEFTAAVNGDHKIKGEVYRVVSDPAYENATGEIDPNNNVFESSYDVVFYDIEIVDIYYKVSGSDERIGLDETTTVLEYGKEYTVYFRVRNNGNVPVTFVYYKDGTLIAEKTLEAKGGKKSEGGFGVCYLTPNGQALGEKEIVGSLYIVDDDGRTLERNYENNTREESYVFKHNVSIDEIYLTATGTDARFDSTDSNGRVMLPANTKVDIHYVLTNHSGKSITVNIFDYNKNMVTEGIAKNQKITIPAYGTVDVTLSKKLSTPSQAGGKYYYAGYVYRAGYKPDAEDPYELTSEDNYYKVQFTVVETPYLEFINPNAPYREGTDVITSYYLYNPTGDAYNGIDRTATVHFVVKIKGTDDIIYEATQSTVVPSFCATKDRAQLVYFKWSVPEDYLDDTDRFEVCAELTVSKFPGMNVSVLSNVQDYITNDVQFTPDTKYEAKEPDGWTKPGEPDIDVIVEQSWKVWTYDGKSFRPNEYSIKLGNGQVILRPHAATDYIGMYGSYFMKSGYGVYIYHIDEGQIYRWDVLDDMVTEAQSAYMIWPEFLYSQDQGKISSLEYVDDEWVLYEFMDYGRVHWTPIWYPDGYYYAYACFSDLWTPLGMVTTRSVCTNPITIDQNMYEDWWIGHGII